MASAASSCGYVVGTRGSLLGGTGAARGEVVSMLPGVTGLVNGDRNRDCVLALCGAFGGDCGDSTFSNGGDRGSVRAVVDKGRCSTRGLGRLGRAIGGPGVTRRCAAELSSEDDQGDTGRGMSKEARVTACVVSCLAISRGAAMVYGVVGPGSRAALLSKRDRRDDTGFLVKSSKH